MLDSSSSEASLGNAFFVVQVNAVVGQDAELDRWYDEQHFDDCLGCKAAVAAQRFAKVPGSGPGGYSYLALYEVADPQVFADDRRSKEGTPQLPRSPALALPAHAFFYRRLPEPSVLLTRPDRRSLYIEFLDVGSSADAAERLIRRQQALTNMPGLGLIELLVVDGYQEREGWHAAAIIFAEILAETDDSSWAFQKESSDPEFRIMESGLYRPISPRRTRA